MDNNGRHYISPEDILAAQDIPELDVEVPEWGGTVRVRAMTLGEVLGIRKATGGDERQMVIHSLQQVFVRPALTMEQAEAMLGKSGGVAQRILAAANQLNGLQPDGTLGLVPAQVRFPEGAPVPAGTDPGA